MNGNADKTILCFASGYEAPPTSKHHIMHLLTERNVVLWVNYHASRAWVLKDLQQRARHLYWLNPEPRLYWNYGDSVIAAYEKHCTAFECWRTDQLEEFVNSPHSRMPVGRKQIHVRSNAELYRE